jgi:hypothetical protein
MWWLHQDSLPLTVRVCDSTASLRHSFALMRDKSGAVGVNTTHSRLVAVSISFLQDVHCNYFLFYVRIPCVWSKVNKTIRLNKIILVATSKPPDFFKNVISCLNWLILAYLRSIFAGLPKSAQPSSPRPQALVTFVARMASQKIWIDIGVLLSKHG